jgi:hypothetical protein
MSKPKARHATADKDTVKHNASAKIEIKPSPDPPV